jgi:hypothetical protein
LKFFAVSSPFYSGDGAGSGAGAIGQGAGGSGPVDGGAPSGGSLPSGAGSGGSVFDLTPDAMVRVPGQKDPVKFSDWQSRHVPQSEFTKKAQALAQERQAWEQERTAAAQKLIEEARRIAELKRGGGQQQEDPLAELRQQNYVDGRTAAGMLEAIQQRGIAPIINAINERDQVITKLHEQVNGLAGLVQKMQQASGMSALEGRIKGVAKNLGLPDSEPGVVEWLQDLYASHEGPDWDTNFETTAKQRLEGLRKVLRDADRKAAADAKRKLLTGAGGSAVPGRKLNEGFKKASDVANSFAEALGIPD